MKAFVELFTRLDETNRTSEKTAALIDYFSISDSLDAAWAIYFLSGRKPRALVSAPKLWTFAAEFAQLPDWLFAECYEAVGDLAETIALVLPPPDSSIDVSLAATVDQLLSLR